MASLTLFTANAFDLFLLDVAMKAAVVLAIGSTIALTMSRVRTSAAARHMVWSMAVVGAVCMPALVAVLPAWNIPVLPPQARMQSDQPVELVQLPTPAPSPMFAAIEQPASLSSAASEEASWPLSSDTLPPAAEVVLAASAPAALTWTWMGIVWLIGAGAALLPTCLGLISLRLLALRSRSVTGGPLYVAMQQAMRQLELTAPVRLLQSSARTMPMTWGVLRPVVLLPEGAEDWTGERLRVVLLHELAHVKRRDCAVQVLAQVARSMHWLNPLAWVAERRLRVEQEQACDDLVLGAGCRPCDYAHHLLDISSRLRSPARVAAIALAMSRTAKIERRLRSILDVSQDRRPLSRKTAIGLAVEALVLVVAVSAVQLAAAAAEEQPAAAAAARSDQPDTQAAGQTAAPADHVATIADLRAKIATQYVTPIDEHQIVEGAIRGMLGALNDPYSDYLTPEMAANLEKQIGGSLVGIGVQLELHEQRVRVVTALPDSPALKAGIQPGDVILQVDGKPVGALTDAVKQIAGPAGSVVRLTLGRAAGLDLEIDVTRAPIKLQTVKGFRRGPDHRWEHLLDAEHKLGYVQIAQFGNATPQETRAAVESLKARGLKGLILDLRFCPGGMLDSAVSVSKLFLAGGTIVSLHSRDGETTRISADNTDALGDFPMIVLVNGQTASAAEVVAGALQDNQRAIVLGTRTIGKGSVQSLIKLEGEQGSIKLTTSHYRLPGGRNIDKRPDEPNWGIDPNEGYFVPVERPQVKTLLERHAARDIIGAKKSNDAAEGTKVTPEWIETELADRQLAAALKTLTARVEDGSFVKVGDYSADAMRQFLKREDALQRRESVVKSLEQLDRELAELGR